MSEPLAGVRDGYDRWAAVYDHDLNPLVALEGPIVRTAVDEVRGWTCSTWGAARGATPSGWRGRAPL